MSRAPPNGYRNNLSTGSAASFPHPQPPPPPLQQQQRLATPTQHLRASSPGSSAGMSRAERFEDEKRRIIESCFSKVDANAQLAESYITHIRVQEDAQYPSSPPPPESAPDNKKPRLIIIAVRSTGRVRLHKARENTNGSFSIGKTWNLEELSAIESFAASGPYPQDERERVAREWAGGVGFAVTITKPYYWQAGTSKEKDFFIASAVKIYKKYTKGQVPELKGFDEKDKAMMLGVPPMQQQQQQQPTPPPSSNVPLGQSVSMGQSVSPGQRAAQGRGFSGERVAQNRDVSGELPEPPQPPYVQREHSRDGGRYRQSPTPQTGAPETNPFESAAAVRQHSESPARPWPEPSQPQARSVTSPEPMRARSRESGRNENRSGSSSAVGQSRPTTAQQQGLPTPGAPYAHSRSGSPSTSSVVSGRDALAKVQQQRPSRQGSYEQSIQSVPEDVTAAPTPKTNGASAGANLFQATRQRWMGLEQQVPAQLMPGQPTPKSTPRLPPIETTQPVRSNDEQTPIEHQPKTATSEASSAAIDLGDAAAAIRNYWGPETSTPTAAEHPIVEDPSSPPTPERSRLRAQMQNRNQSATSVDLRPQPLKQGSRTPEPGTSQYGTPRENGSIVATPMTEEPPVLGSSGTQNAQVSAATGDGTLQMPGAFSPSPAGPSPQATPVATPSLERTEDQAQQPQAERKAGEPFRPGLGPMVKKRVEVANKFMKAASAASAANAFKPRPGGAAEKILKAKAEREAGFSSGELDGVSGFVPRPSTATRQDSTNSVVTAASPLSVKEPAGLGLQNVKQEQPPLVEVTSPDVPAQVPTSSSAVEETQHLPVELKDEQPIQQDHLQTPEQQQHHDTEEEAERALFEQREARKPQVKVKRRSNQQERNLAALGIDRSLLEGKGLAFEAVLEDFGWSDKALETKKLTEMEVDLRREQGRLEAGSWLNSTDAQREERVQQVENLLDKAIQECDELEGLLTLYSVELGSLNEDIAFIEAQSQGLQVQSANQKLLHSELEGLVETMSLDRQVLEPLRHGDLGDMAGLEQVEASVGRLYQAMVTIDPSIRTAGAVKGRRKSRNSLSGEGAGEVSRMKALREKREVYEMETGAFCQRLMQQLDFAFTNSLRDANGRAMRSDVGAKRLNKEVFSECKRGLWAYSPLILFTKELSPPAWQTGFRLYCTKAQPVYLDCFKENLMGWKRAARRPTTDEADLLFTAAEKEEPSSGGNGGLAAARKLTVKRSQTLAKTLRNASGGKSPTESRHAGQMLSSEVFAGAMDEMAPLISQEQNFIVDLFHASSLETTDFLDIVGLTSPAQRVGTNLLTPKPMDPDREMAKRVTSVMDEIFGFFVQEMGSMLEWSVASDPIQGVGVMACLSRHAYFLQESSQEFLLQLLDILTSRLQSLWVKFIDEQVRAIEDTKVKIKKRKGVIGFMKIFPPFSAAVENVFSTVARDDYDGPADCMFEVRRLVDEAYARLNRAMFDSLKVIAKESPAAGQQAQPPGRAGDDPEDKQMLNYHILVIENMNHYIEEVDDGGKEGVLAEWKGRALLDRAEALEGYLGRVIRRPVGRLLDFLDSTESLLASHPTNPTAIASRPSYSRKAARHLFSQYDGKEIRRGIDTLRKRIEKHFGDADEESIARELVGFVCKECERSYERTLDRMEKIIREVYPVTEGEKSVEVEFSRADVQAGFRR